MEVAGNLGYTPTKYVLFESESEPHPRIINAIEFLGMFAQLEGISVTDFIEYLVGEKQPVKLSWEEEVCAVLKRIPIKIIRGFVTKIKTCDSIDDTKILSEILSIYSTDIPQDKKIIMLEALKLFNHLAQAHK